MFGFDVLSDVVDVHLSTLLLAAGLLVFTFIGFVVKSRFIIRVFSTGFLAGLMYSILYNMYSDKMTAWDIMVITSSSALAGYILSYMVPSKAKGSIVANA